ADAVVGFAPFEADYARRHAQAEAVAVDPACFCGQEVSQFVHEYQHTEDEQEYKNASKHELHSTRVHDASCPCTCFTICFQNLFKTPRRLDAASVHRLMDNIGNLQERYLPPAKRID